MKRQVLTAVCAAFAMTIGLAAQDPPSSTSRDQTAKDANSITLTGCLAKGEMGATGTSGSTSASRPAAGGQFVLNNAKMGSATTTSPGAAAGGTTAAAGATAGAAGTSGASYILDGTESELTRHVGHKVEITGTLDKSASASASAPSATSPAGSASASVQQHVKVTAIKMVSSSCTN